MALSISSLKCTGPCMERIKNEMEYLEAFQKSKEGAGADAGAGDKSKPT